MNKSLIYVTTKWPVRYTDIKVLVHTTQALTKDFRHNSDLHVILQEAAPGLLFLSQLFGVLGAMSSFTGANLRFCARYFQACLYKMTSGVYICTSTCTKWQYTSTCTKWPVGYTSTCVYKMTLMNCQRA